MAREAWILSVVPIPIFTRPVLARHQAANLSWAAPVGEEGEDVVWTDQLLRQLVRRVEHQLLEDRREHDAIPAACWEEGAGR